MLAYDTSGPYTDPSVQTDINLGVARLRQTWIENRDDSVELTHSESHFREQRFNRLDLDAIPLSLASLYSQGQKRKKRFSASLCPSRHCYLRDEYVAIREIYCANHHYPT
ncbi:hypothetical protein [Teredinibacter franksiae]|uniref:hypothetical protein n=1 Tax=Teredinibacter franksiae TaxID=2761453 RepID=UPI0028AAD1BE|nr:hypothetical protein [Teredinibacter franksiae]